MDRPGRWECAVRRRARQARYDATAKGQGRRYAEGRRKLRARIRAKEARVQELEERLEAQVRG